MSLSPKRSAPGVSLRFGGVILLDVDGTCNKPGEKETIWGDVITQIARYVSGGGTIIPATNRPTRWVEEKMVAPVLARMREETNDWISRATSGVILIPEQGCAVLALNGVSEEAGRFSFAWDALYQRKVPERKLLLAFASSEILPSFPGSRMREGTEYTLTLEKLEGGKPQKALSLVEEKKRAHSEIPWEGIRVLATRSTLSFVNAGASKGEALKAAFKLVRSRFESGSSFGIGDGPGDDFASVIPTFNVGEKDAFRKQGLPAITYGEAEILREGEYKTEKAGAREEVVRSTSGEVIQVLRDSEGRVLRTQPFRGNPIQILQSGGGRRLTEGPATAKILEGLMGAGILDRIKNV